MTNRPEYRFSAIERASLCEVEYGERKHAVIDNPAMRRGSAVHAILQDYVDFCVQAKHSTDADLMAHLKSKNTDYLTLPGPEREYADYLLDRFMDTEDCLPPEGFSYVMEHDLKLAMLPTAGGLLFSSPGSLGAAAWEQYVAGGPILEVPYREGYVFGGRLDRLLLADDQGVLIVRDYKTDRRIAPESEAKYDLQVRAYAALALGNYAKVQRAVCQIHYLVGPQIMEWEIGPDEAGLALEEIDALVQKARAVEEKQANGSLLTPTPGRRCSRCLVFHRCPAASDVLASARTGRIGQGGELQADDYVLAKRAAEELEEGLRLQASEEPVYLSDGNAVGFETKVRRKVSEEAKKLLAKHFTAEEILEVATLSQAGIKKLLKGAQGIDPKGLMEKLTTEERYTKFGVLGGEEE